MAATVRKRRRARGERDWRVKIFSALSDTTRVEMLEMILDRGEVGSSEFDEHFLLSKSTISYHTNILSKAGLIETFREGRFLFYRPRLEEVEAKFPGLLDQLRRR